MCSPKAIFKFILMSLFLFLCCGTVSATQYSFLNRPFILYGYVEQEGAIAVNRGSDYYGKNVTNYSSFQLEWQYKIIPDKFHIYSVNRVITDWNYTIYDDKSWFKDANRTPARRSVARRNMQYNWNRYDRGWEVLREIYADIFLGDFHFRWGKQQVVWGESDGLRLMDCINPLDSRRGFNLWDSDEGYKNVRIPLWLLVTTYYPQIEPFGIRDLRIETVINPGKPRTNRLEAFRSDGGVWAAQEPNLPWGARVGIKDRPPKTRLKNAEFAMRIMGDFKDWIFTLNALYGVQHDPYVIPQDPNLILPPWDNRFIQLNIDQKYGWRKLVGFTLNTELTKIKIPRTASPVLRVEALYEFDKPFIYEGKHSGDMAWSGLNPDFTTYKKMRDQIRAMIGFDWNIYLRFINPRESIFMSTQFFVFYMPDGKGGELVNAPFYFTKRVQGQMLPPLPGTRDKRFIDPWRVHRTQKFFSFLVTTPFDNKRIEPQALFLHDLNEHASGLKVRVRLSYGDHWRPELGFMGWWGDQHTGKSMGLFQKNNHMYLKIRYQF